jgi:hypothetical protein
LCVSTFFPNLEVRLDDDHLTLIALSHDPDPSSITKITQTLH